GREAADLVIEDPQVSRRHASVRPAGDSLEIEDLGSLNGTWVNGARLTGKVRLALGDQVRVGDSFFEVEVEAEATAVRAAPTEAGQAPAPAPPLAFSPPPRRPARRRPTVATRRLTPTLLSFGTVIATAIALVLYFAMR
ncbi:MAG TPA: FHA domain-containing protein, partial [Actinomycetes bacterium]|nr:FHA domain-containing protein [Actinomycetes bacterium]